MNRTYLGAIYFLTFALVCSFFSSCNSYKKLPYLSNLDSTQIALMTNQGVNEPQIKPNDLLTISVNSSIPGAANDFNLSIAPSVYNSVLQANVTSGGGNGGSTTSALQNYLVDKNGCIQFPVFGEIKVAGKTVRELQNDLVHRIYPKYITSEPIVTVRIENFQVSVLGEVSRPGTFSSENGQMTIFDALAAAGDLTIYGKRDNVLLLRTTASGDVLTYRINLQDKNSIANKDIFYLQQNDKLYVEINKAKGNNSRFGTIETLSISTISILLSLATLITRF